MVLGIVAIKFDILCTEQFINLVEIFFVNFSFDGFCGLQVISYSLLGMVIDSFDYDLPKPHPFAYYTHV